MVAFSPRPLNTRLKIGAFLAVSFLYVLWSALSSHDLADTIHDVGDVLQHVKPAAVAAASRPWRVHAPPAAAPPAARPAAPTRRISIVVIWEGGFPFPAVVNLFDSVIANAAHVELVWIGLRADTGDACWDIRPHVHAPADPPNVKFVCLTQEEYWTAHRDYFCQQWRCTESERDLALDVFSERQNTDSNKSLYRIWRGYIFKKYIDPNAEWWGWADVDTFMGSFSSMFPWDVASEFDVIIPGHGESLIYLRGHLNFIQTRAETEAKMNGYENMMTLDAFIHKHNDVYWCAEEAEFSAFVARDTRISFLVLPHHLTEVSVDLRLNNTALFASHAGTFTMATPLNSAPALPGFPDFPVLALPRMPQAPRRTFTRAGVTRAVELHLGGKHAWVPAQFTTWYDWDSDPPRPGFGARDPLRIIGRGGGFEGGAHGVWVRYEPQNAPVLVRAARDPGVTVALQEGLYIHWTGLQHNYERVFKSLPVEPLRTNEVLVSYYTEGADIWDLDRGMAVWRTP